LLPNFIAQAKQTNMAPQIKLIYFDGRGRAEAARYILAQADVKYEDKRVTHETWPSLKPSIPLGQLPAMEVDGKILGQSKAICRYLAKQFKLTGKDDWESALCDAYVDCVDDVTQNLRPWFMEKDVEKKKAIWEKFAEDNYKPFLARIENILKENGTGYMVGKDLTWADLYVFDCLSNVQYRFPEEKYIAPHAKVSEFYKKIETLPKIKTWIEKRPKSEF
jgi:glutathione S-transferase